MTSVKWYRRVAMVICAGVLAGCSGVADEESAESVASVSEPLLGTPGAFYTVAPNFGWCGIAVSSVSGACHGGYSFNSSGGTNSMTRLAAGVYRVRFPGLASGGNAQVSGIGGNVHCGVLSAFPSGADEMVDVICRSAAGALVDSRFLVSYYRDTNVGGPLGAYATVRAASGSPTVTDAWNSSGGAVLVSALGAGVYRVFLPGQAALGNSVFVTAVGSTSVHCHASSWGSAAGGAAAEVRCFNFTGGLVNGDFSFWYGSNIRGEPRNSLPTGTQGAFSLVNAGGGINPSFSRNSCAAGSNTATLMGVGSYAETYHAITQFQGEVPTFGMTMAVSTAGAYCNLAAFPIQGVRSDSRLSVSCFSPNGAPAASTQHNSMMMLQDKGGC
ncbi:MAG: hypothetical protein ACOY0T_33615 [Myxococcota bacterium]